METIGIILMGLGAIMILGAKRIIMGKWKPDEKYPDGEDLILLIRNAVILVRVVGFGIVAVGMVFMFIFVF